MEQTDPLVLVMTSAEAAESLQVTKRQVARLCKDNKLRYRETPGGLLILRASVEAYIEQKKSRIQ